MNRRTVLRGAAAVVPLSLSGCVETIVGDRDLTTPVPIRVESEASSYHYLEITAHDPDTGRQTYEKEITVRSGETARPPHLDNQPQRLRIVIVDREEFDEDDITEDTKNVRVTITDDDLVIEVDERGNDQG